MSNKSKSMSCVVPFCSNTGTEKFHKLPKDPVLRQKWIKKASLDETKLHSSSRVCHLHFKSDDYIKVRLKEGTFPTQNLPVRHFDLLFLLTACQSLTRFLTKYHFSPNAHFQSYFVEFSTLNPLSFLSK